MQVKPADLARHLRAGLAPAYLISGDEMLLVQEACDAVLAAARGEGYTERSVLHAEPGFDWNDVLQDASSMSLFAERRVVDVRADGALRRARRVRAHDAELRVRRDYEPAAQTRARLARISEEAGTPARPLDAGGERRCLSLFSTYAGCASTT